MSRKRKSSNLFFSGVLVLTLALLPQMSGRTSHLVRAESPGPTLSKIVPRMGDTAKVLYLLYHTEY